jgi:hypothetical protein
VRSDDVIELGTIGIGLVALYFVYQALKGPVGAAAAAAGAAVNSGEQAVANLFPGTAPSVIPLGNVLLPSGATVPVSSLNSNGFNDDGSLSMSDASGNTYEVTSLGNGTYQAS